MITNNGTQFACIRFEDFCKKREINLRFSSTYHPQSNDMIEVINRTILQQLKERLHQAKGNWPEEVPHILWAYRTTPKIAIGEIPISLVYGAEAVIPVEIQVSRFGIQYPKIS